MGLVAPAGAATFRGPWSRSARTLGRIALAAAIGVIAWGEHVALIGLAAALPALWWQAGSRGAATGVVLAYYLASARGIPVGAAVFFGEHAAWWHGGALWLAASALLALPWALLWAANGRGRWWRLPVALGASLVPPLGAIGWTHPIAATGIALPGAGWIGLASFVALLAWACASRAASTALVAVTLAIGTIAADPTPPAHWRGVDTRLGGDGAGAPDFVRQYARNRELIAMLANVERGSVSVLPELAAGLWMQPSEDLWAATIATLAERDATVLVGAERPVAGTRKRANVMLVLGRERAEIPQRMPVPVSMYRPWADDGYVADWFASGVATVAGERIALVVCFEQVLAWPVLRSLVERPALIVGAANSYWSQQTSIPAIQRSTLRAWSRLFGVPLVTAVNS
jgi:hypothetical protein